MTMAARNGAQETTDLAVLQMVSLLSQSQNQWWLEVMTMLVSIQPVLREAIPIMVMTAALHQVMAAAKQATTSLTE